MEYPHVYLAGPDVFRQDAVAYSSKLKDICMRHNLIGRFPLDNEILTSGKSLHQIGYLISAENEKLIRQCDGVLANLTPFRGPSADVGTVYEIGFARGLGKTIVGYTNDGSSVESRTIKWLSRLGESIRVRKDDSFEDVQGMTLESFSLIDNLMIPGGICASGGTIVVPSVSIDLLVLVNTAAAELARLLYNIAAPVGKEKQDDTDLL